MKIFIIILIIITYIFVYTSPYRDGLNDGERMALNSFDKYKWSILSCLSSFIFSGCGCIGISVFSYMSNISLPFNEQEREKMYVLGFKKTYIPKVKKDNVKYAIIGGGIGTVLNLAFIILLFSLNNTKG